MTTQRYQVNPDISVIVDDKQIIVRASENTYRLSDTSLSTFIAEVLSTADNITLPPLSDEVDESDVARLHEALTVLEKAEVLVQTQETCWPDSVVSLHNRCGGTVDYAVIMERLKNARVTIVGDPTTGAVRQLLEALGPYPLAEPTVVSRPADIEASDATLAVVSAPDMYDPVLKQMNEHALEVGLRVWVPMTPALGGSFTIGPWYYPNKSACHECLRLRQGSVEREETLGHYQRNGLSIRPRSDRTLSQPAMTSMMVAMLTDSIVQHVALDGAHGQAVVGGITQVSRGLEGFETSTHRVLRVPRCPSCSLGEGTGYPQIWYHEE